jgi:hypothetical protein
MKCIGVLNLVHVDFGCSRNGPDVFRLVVEMVPSVRVVQPANHVDAIGRDDEVTVVQVMLLWSEDVHQGAGLLPWILGLPSGDRRAQDSSSNHDVTSHEFLA